ncbi:MAG TPA: hypothetical protein VL463_02810 [Kofleriaceae bacterium]|jgi:hypothetical protein|nr:hypothetical protein [Kofleriaceae bacterium]
MRWIPLLLVAACTHYSPVGADEARLRSYPVSIARAREVAGATLENRYGRLDRDDARYLLTHWVCRTPVGDPCPTVRETNGRPDNPWAPPSDVRRIDTRSSADGGLRIGVIIRGVDGAVQIAVEGESHYSDRPDWLQHEVDEDQVAIDRALRSR